MNIRVDRWFDPNMETTIEVVWISMSYFPPNIFAKQESYPIDSIVGKPLAVDMETRKQTIPSCTRVKVEVDLVVKLAQRVKINEEDDMTGEIKYKWIKIKYDYIPKYCKEY